MIAPRLAPRSAARLRISRVLTGWRGLAQGDQVARCWRAACLSSTREPGCERQPRSVRGGRSCAGGGRAPLHRRRCALRAGSASTVSTRRTCPNGSRVIVQVEADVRRLARPTPPHARALAPGCVAMRANVVFRRRTPHGQCARAPLGSADRQRDRCTRPPPVRCGHQYR